MMRKLMIAAVLAAFTLTVAPAAMAATSTTEQAELLKKKKKKAEAARKLELKKKQDAAAARKKAALKKQQDARKKSASRRDCGSFLECLLGKPRPASGVRRASYSDGGSAMDSATSEVVSWNDASKYAAGSIIVKTPERALYLVMGDGKARRYKVGVGRDGFQWSGNSKIVSKQEWPTWRPPPAMIEREAAKGHFLPEVMEGGPENPLGARALYIGGTLYRIHGTNNADSIGGAVSSGCIRMMNTDVVDLYDRVRVGAKVYVYQ